MIIYSKKLFDFFKSSIFYAPLKYGKSYWNRRHFGSRLCYKGQGSGDYCDITSRTRPSVFHTILYSLLVYVWKVRSILVANSRNMPHRYVVGGCSHVRSSENGIALHTIPFYGDERLEAKKWRKRWIDFVRQKPEKCAWWDPSQSLVICPKHFKADDFVRNYALIIEKQAQSVPYLVARQCRVYRLPNCSCGGTSRRTTLERSRQKNDKIFRLCSSSSLAFISSWYLSNHSASASGSSA